MCKIDSQWEAAVLCDDLEGWDGGDGREAQEGRAIVYIQLIHFVVQQKLAKHCKANTLHPPPKKILHATTEVKDLCAATKTRHSQISQYKHFFLRYSYDNIHGKAYWPNAGPISFPLRTGPSTIHGRWKCQPEPTRKHNDKEHAAF